MKIPLLAKNQFQEEEPVVPKRGRPKRSKQIEPISPPPTLKKTRTTRSSPTPYENPIENSSQSSTSSNEFASQNIKQRNSKRVKNQRGPVTKVSVFLGLVYDREDIY